MSNSPGIADLRFLVGRWRGEGTLRGKPVTSRSECRVSPNAPDALTLRVQTLRGGAVIHEEDVHWMTDSSLLVRCVTRPRSDEEQVWRVRALEGGRAWELTRPGHHWTVRRTGDDAWEETFATVAADGAVVPVVVLSHVRDAGDAAGAPPPTEPRP
jgi:hypothetical protein